MGNKIDRIGETYPSKEGYSMTIIGKRGNNYDIIFNDKRGTIKYNVQHQGLRRGTVKNPYHPSIFGVGYVGEGRHKTKVNGKMTKMYYVYVDMIRRSYRSNKTGKNPSYKNVTVCKDWLNYQNFGDWFEKKFDYNTEEVWHLDKDILSKGNQIYSEENCAFVPREINNLFIKADKVRGKYPIGVSFNQGKFKALLRKIEGEKRKGTFDNEWDAFQAYKKDKEAHIKEVAERWRVQIEEPVYFALMNYEVEITD